MLLEPKGLDSLRAFTIIPITPIPVKKGVDPNVT